MTVWLIVFGFISGILGGMGMGGGTLLIPLLNFLDIEQQTIQAINLISFLPMACVALGLHFKNKLVKPRRTLCMIAPACAFCILGALLTKNTSSEVLKICFGVFMLLLGVWQLILSVRQMVKERKTDKERSLFSIRKIKLQAPDACGGFVDKPYVHSRTSAMFGRSDRGEKSAKKRFNNLHLFFHVLL